MKELIENGKRSMRYPDGPRGREVLGFFGRGRFPSTLAFLQNAAERFGPLTYFRLLHQRTYLATGPEFVKEILVTQQHRFGRDFGATILKELVGDAVITREEPLHKERRRILQPAFHREQIAAYVETMADEAQATARKWEREAEAGRLTVDIGAAMQGTTLTVIGRLLFGEEFRSRALAISEVLRDVFKRVRRIAPLVSVLKVMTRQYRRLLPNAPSLYFRKQRAELDRILQPLIEHRRKHSGRDVLSLLLALHDDGAGTLSSEDIRNEMVTFVLAGHETTATALTWALHLLARHPDIQERAAAEVQNACGDRPLRIDDLPGMPLIGAIFTETLRLYPPVPMFGRRVLEDVQLGGYTIPRGSTVLLSSFITQRNSDLYPRPMEFDPGRWLAGEPPKFAFLPFGGGAKMCIGDVFAKTEGAVILATLLRDLAFRPATDGEMGIDSGVTLKPKGPILLDITVRGQRSNVSYSGESRATVA